MIARGTLNDFVTNRVARSQRAGLKAHLDAWFAEVAKAEWKNSAELKLQYGSASVVSAERVVFNIKGNAYRLVVSIHYDYGIVLIKWIGTHREYDKIDVREVNYEKGRYTSPSDQD